MNEPEKPWLCDKCSYYNSGVICTHCGASRSIAKLIICINDHPPTDAAEFEEFEQALHERFEQLIEEVIANGQLPAPDERRALALERKQAALDTIERMPWQPELPARPANVPDPSGFMGRKA